MSSCGRGAVLAGLLAGLGLALGACSTTPGGFGAPTAPPLVLTSTQPPAEPAGAPTVLADQGALQPAPPPTAYTELAPLPSPGSSTGAGAGTAPAAGPPGGSGLLSPQEKARVVAELEALARAQTPPTIGIVPPCTLDPAVVAALPQPLTAEQAAALCASANP